MPEVPESHTGWTFLTNHSRVLAAIAENPTIRIRDIAARCRLTERAVQKIVADLETAGYLTHTRQGRSNAYQIEDGTILRHPADEGLRVAELLSLLSRHDDAHAEGRRELQATAPHARSPEDDQ
ncbi:helix-turn-helix domain-containing protein [Streptomyces sp. SID12501]|uniref:MarR family transcriptional regulator n=1 Tax=Streptomyces sp. SID12501 TaxID=2706042 RepID=A0A6B3C1Z8_9ACTN|nr:helix-turn-helix domain-containing protein [Streptomyces sp. SID12501]NEC90496.1 MarR family transcriptional regulator [Streptomyces sp. SID12501]